MIDRRRLIGLSFLAPVLAAAGQAQGFASVPVTTVAPCAAGGTSDIIARVVGEGRHELLKQPVPVENRPGANGSIGVSAVSRAAPGAHTPLRYRKLAYDVERDLAPVSITGRVPNVVVVNPKVPARSLDELIAVAKAKPGGLTYASQSIGSDGQMNAELFRLATGVPLLHVPYKGSAQAVTETSSRRGASQSRKFSKDIS